MSRRNFKHVIKYKRTIGIILTFIISIFIFNRFLNRNITVTEEKIYQECESIFNKNLEVIEAAEKWVLSHNKTDEFRLHQAVSLSCDDFLIDRKYFLKFPKDNDEKLFPIAFPIVIFKSFIQFERLLRMIYRPWNYYCIHVDIKSDPRFLLAIEELVKCLSGKYKNIISTKNRVNVQWGTFSVLSADLNCMKELFDNYKDWKYLINLTGQEFPLKTNAELVKILKAYKGANNVHGTYKWRFDDRFPETKMPFPLVWFYGSVHITVNRDFIAFIFQSPKSQIILNNLKNQSVPDESFFSTLNYNPQLRIPGSFIGDPDEIIPIRETYLYHLARYKNWGDYPCRSEKFVHNLCVWGVKDLQHLIKVPHLFANKFYEDFQPATLICLEKWYYDKVNREIKTGNVTIDENFYSSLPFVINQYVPPVEN